MINLRTIVMVSYLLAGYQVMESDYGQQKLYFMWLGVEHLYAYKHIANFQICSCSYTFLYENKFGNSEPYLLM